MTQTFKTRYGLSNAIKVYTDPNATSATPQVVGYKGRNTFDSAAFYTPYIPLQMGGVMPGSAVIRISMDEIADPWFPVRVHVEFDGNLNKDQSARLREVIRLWCTKVWGDPGLWGFGEWSQNIPHVHVRTAEQAFEMKMRWHGVKV